MSFLCWLSTEAGAVTAEHVSEWRGDEMAWTLSFLMTLHSKKCFCFFLIENIDLDCSTPAQNYAFLGVVQYFPVCWLPTALIWWICVYVLLLNPDSFDESLEEPITLPNPPFSTYKWVGPSWPTKGPHPCQCSSSQPIVLLPSQKIRKENKKRNGLLIVI